MQVRKLICVYFLLIASFESLAHLSELTCSKGGTKIIFINGVNVDDTKFLDFKRDAETFAGQIEKIKTDPKDLNFIVLHNSSANILIDAGETYFEFLKSMGIKNPELSDRFLEILMATYTGNYSTLNPSNDLEFFAKKSLEILVTSHQKAIDEDIANIYREASSGLYQDKRVIFITHSGGAIIADRVRDRILKNDGEYYNFSSHIALARPFRTYHKQVLNYSFDADPVLYSLRLTSPDVPASNVKLIGDCPGSYWKFEFLKNHDFRCYVGDVLARSGNATETSSSLIRSLVYNQASEFKNNDENCCNKAEGKVWLNNGVTPGGFVSDSVQITGTSLAIDKESQICGSGHLNMHSSVFSSIVDSRLFGELNIAEPFSFNKLVSGKKSHITITKNNSSFEDSTIDGKITTHPSLFSLKT